MPSKSNNVSSLKPAQDKPAVLNEKPIKSPTLKIQRINKGFQIEKNRAAKWDLLVAKMKSAEDKKTGPVLMDEALDYLFDKYLNN